MGAQFFVVVVVGTFTSPSPPPGRSPSPESWPRLRTRRLRATPGPPSWPPFSSGGKALAGGLGREGVSQRQSRVCVCGGGGEVKREGKVALTALTVPASDSVNSVAGRQAAHQPAQTPDLGEGEASPGHQRGRHPPQVPHRVIPRGGPRRPEGDAPVDRAEEGDDGGGVGSLELLAPGKDAADPGDVLRDLGYLP